MTKKIDDDALSNVAGGVGDQNIRPQEDVDGGTQNLDEKEAANQSDVGGSGSNERRTGLAEG